MAGIINLTFLQPFKWQDYNTRNNAFQLKITVCLNLLNEKSDPVGETCVWKLIPDQVALIRGSVNVKYLEIGQLKKPELNHSMFTCPVWQTVLKGSMKFHENLFQNQRNKGPQTYEGKYARGKVLPSWQTCLFKNWQVWGSIFERVCNIFLLMMNHPTVTKFGMINWVAMFIFCFNLKKKQSSMTSVKRYVVTYMLLVLLGLYTMSSWFLLPKHYKLTHWLPRWVLQLGFCNQLHRMPSWTLLWCHQEKCSATALWSWYLQQLISHWMHWLSSRLCL